MRILGVDPGLNITGYGVIEVSGAKVAVCEAGVIRSTAKAPLPERLSEIHDGMCDVFSSLAPETAALEQLYSHYARPTTAILMGHARGVICLAAAQANVAISSYAATQIKKQLTGSGRAGKEQMQWAVQRELNLSELPEPPDVADALAAALCHLHLSVRNRFAGTLGA